MDKIAHIRHQNLRTVLLVIVVCQALAFAFAGGWTLAESVEQGGIVAALGRMAQLVPGVFNTEAGADIPSATDLTPLKTFWKARQRVLQSYVYPDQIDQAQLTYGAIRGMLDALGDPYSRFMTPEEYKEFQTESEGHFDGIGAMLVQDVNELTGEKTVRVTEIIPEGPAAQTDLRPGDIILAVDGKPVRGLRLQQVVEMIRGPSGTPVVLTVRHSGSEEMVDIQIIRGRVEFPTIEHRMLDAEIGYIWLRSFNRSAGYEVQKALEDLQAKGMKALLFDLSSDPGGMLDQAIAVASHFIQDTPVTFIKDRGGAPDPLMARPGLTLDEDIPMVVLIDGGSASASEIVAGAMQDLGRATIVGHPSFGKAKVQTVIELDDGSAIVLTTAVYLTPKQRDISRGDNGGGGIQPDVRFPDPPKERDRTLTYRQWYEQWHAQQVERALAVLREKMKPAAG